MEGCHAEGRDGVVLTPRRGGIKRQGSLTRKIMCLSLRSDGAAMRHILHTISPTAKRRHLRSHMTLQEVRLWARLQKRGLVGYKFRRQHQIGPYIVDFYCPRLKLAIELDGGYHFELEQRAYDRERQRYIESLGVKVVRYTNADVDSDIDAVLEDLTRKMRRRSEMPPRS